ncbi:MAG: hypothetical protein E6Q97_39655 [Desulfurellales bacterium]|nr:MAG: hypothetical protein E6Q97_39655 [Desulfurellales bacterium]
MTQDWTEGDLRDSLRRVFQETQKFNRTPFIHFDGHSARNPFLRAGWNLAVENGWLRVEAVELEQDTFMKGFLTDKGRQELLFG